ncbi:hypothetical protein [Nocardiopsis sp. TNDT3]|uniref:hypothetical protein n=1 Tax=Nocardiopsis sp. TNDT3 TaxID=2249354 RepID=UPI000E3D4CF3|nr:hypothetical protein [Nocardiopsis sp. TNDT3]
MRIEFNEDGFDELEAHIRGATQKSEQAINRVADNAAGKSVDQVAEEISHALRGNNTEPDEAEVRKLAQQIVEHHSS